ncbi:MAG: bifunctional diaminohydroxyphosphoribosylaminopyrimidine deaminase/5-amino-6-(5-phosphoribosylamino)uracil reductase RibD, partial [Chloroflexi bacterium]|nr:bifunctional diaminohydroxyphosphoribosylaminopyrimidine deaminase/5-amino-6-(5-phosphoribosylamino)uracil reductase RibD [Chloroflexota bacterium]
MRRAFELARQALGTTSPRPAVGAVLVKGGQIVGEGYTQPPWGPHAEAVALGAAGELAQGAILYVTLEPCCHQGHTHPCTDAIVKAGVAQVRMAMIDPNPKVSGKGLQALKQAGINTYCGEGQEEAMEINEAYFKYMSTSQPFVIAKFAASLDGKIATREGDSRWITGEEARRYAHVLRAQADAIMVGVNTVLRDDPQLTPRLQGRPVRRYPLRVVLDSRGRTPLSARLFQEPGSTLVAVARVSEGAKLALEQAGAEVVLFPGEGGQVDLSALMKHLASKELISILVEGGGALLG